LVEEVRGEGVTRMEIMDGIERLIERMGLRGRRSWRAGWRGWRAMESRMESMGL